MFFSKYAKQESFMLEINSLKERLKKLENNRNVGPTLKVPVVDEFGEIVQEYHLPSMALRGHYRNKKKAISFEQVCDAIQDMCGIEITYQRVPGTEGIVIYEKEDD